MTIVENDAIPAQGAIEFAASSGSVSESGGIIALALNRVGGSEGTVQITWQTHDSTAVAGEDFTSGNGVLTFLAGQTENQVSIAISNDTVYEGAESFKIVLSNPQGGAALGAIILARVKR